MWLLPLYLHVNQKSDDDDDDDDDDDYDDDECPDLTVYTSRYITCFVFEPPLMMTI